MSAIKSAVQSLDIDGEDITSSKQISASFAAFFCSTTVRLSGTVVHGVGSKYYLDKLNRRAACISEGRSIRADELKSTLSWSNQATSA